MKLKCSDAILINVQNGKPWNMVDKDTGEVRQGQSYKAEFTDVVNGKAVIIKVDFKSNPDWGVTLQKLVGTGKPLSFDAAYSYGNLSMLSLPVAVN